MQLDSDCPINGSGTIFFTGCNLRCIYCQNYKISNGIVEDRTINQNKAQSKEYTIEELADIIQKLQSMGAANINLVTPTHFSDKIKEAVVIYRKKCELENKNSLPIVYNCSGYESVDTLRSLEGIVDIYLTDFKYMDEDMAQKYSKAKDYPQVAKSALIEMFRQQPRLVYDENGMLQKGIIVRHLILPGHTKNAKAVIEYLAKNYGSKILISVMNQYTPVNEIENRCPELARKITKREYNKVLDYCYELGLDNIYIQGNETAKESFIPDF